ncbi:toxin-antitoxin system HicB family antitoxin [Microbacterium sp. G2-8]|uniref:toxin-antitoxin system HicB family antitoxin n=1 Tax=Microbacterium sp. G2-8 TaxID=2842454 RepID=UPI001C89B53C|nr:toxin-antitoxin system HicB family antitoxin [Microbacterium sp. G2-8]
MHITPHVSELQRQLALAASAGDEATQRAAELLAASVEPAARLAILEALSEAAGEITLQAASITVDARLRGRDIEFAVSGSAETADALAPARPSTPVEDEGATSRTTIRLPENLKTRAEEAAAADGISLNAWLVRAVGSALDSSGAARQARAPHITGWIR